MIYLRELCYHLCSLALRQFTNLSALNPEHSLKLFNEIEEQLSKELEALTDYCSKNQPRPNPGETQTCRFKLKNKGARRKLKLKWNDMSLTHSGYPTY